MGMNEFIFNVISFALLFWCFCGIISIHKKLGKIDKKLKDIEDGLYED
jgi:hypothetical protein